MALAEAPKKDTVKDSTFSDTKKKDGSVDPSFADAVFEACKKDDAQKLAELIYSQSPPNCNFQGCYTGLDKVTPLHVAATEGSINAVKVLIDLRADPTIRDSSGYTAMHEAARRGVPETALLIIRAKGNPGALSIKDITPAHLAAGKGNQEVVRLLCQHGIDPNVRHFAGVTPMQLAAMSNKQMPIPELIAAGGDPNIQDTQGCTVLHYACRMAMADLVGYLLDKGADPNIRNVSGSLPRDEIGVWVGNTPQSVQQAITKHLECPRPPLVRELEEVARFPRAVGTLVTEFAIGPLTTIKPEQPAAAPE